MGVFTITSDAILIPPTVTIVGQGVVINPGAQNFAITAMDTDGTIASWDIDWDDGTSSDGLGVPPTPMSHNFTTLGERTVTIIVTDNDGLTATDSFTFTVEPVSSGFSVTGTTFVGCSGGTASGTLTVTGGTVTVLNDFTDTIGTPIGDNLTIDSQSVAPNNSIVLGVGVYPFSVSAPNCTSGDGFTEIIFT